MNFVGHIHIAAALWQRDNLHQVLPSDESAGSDDGPPRELFLFGSTLPDLASIAQLQLQSDPVNHFVKWGVDIHHSTDRAFHRCMWFSDHSVALSKTLQEKGLNRGASRACGHVGLELLLDGQLLNNHESLSPDSHRVLDLATKPELDLGSIVDPEKRSHWLAQLSRIASWDLPDDFDDPGAIAQRLWRILQPRPRLAFDQTQTSVIAEVLSEAQADVLAGIPAMVDEVTEAVNPQLLLGR